MMATLNEICSKPSTPGREKAKANIISALARMSDYAASAPKGGPVIRLMTIYDRENLLTIADDASRGEEERNRACAILEGDGLLRSGDLEFLERACSR